MSLKASPGLGDNFVISNSYLRNKFLNSKINGKISFTKNFYFDLDLGINQVNLRKLLMYYPILQGGTISKKINGKFGITLKSADSFFGKIKDAKMNLIFENGDIRIENFSDSSIDLLVECFSFSSEWKKFIEIKENLAIKIKQIVENENAGFAFPSQSIYVESISNEKTEIFDPKK